VPPHERVIEGAFIGYPELTDGSARILCFDGCISIIPREEPLNLPAPVELPDIPVQSKHSPLGKVAEDVDEPDEP